MTPHIEAKIEDIAETVIMPGDPLRAELIARTYLTDYKLVNKVRNIFAYTGYYNNKLITIMASGMGMGSIGIYSYELFKYYNVKNIIRVGSCGAYTSKINLGDVILVKESYTDSNYAYVGYNDECNLIESSNKLNNYFINEDVIMGRILTSDVFYKENEDFKKMYNEYNCLGVEMESFALFYNAKKLGKNATCLLTVSDNFETDKHLTSDERQNSFKKMMEIALRITE